VHLDFAIYGFFGFIVLNLLDLILFRPGESFLLLMFYFYLIWRARIYLKYTYVFIKYIIGMMFCIMCLFTGSVVIEVINGLTSNKESNFLGSMISSNVGGVLIYFLNIIVIFYCYHVVFISKSVGDYIKQKNA
jgi:hypothetical protein